MRCVGKGAASGRVLLEPIACCRMSAEALTLEPWLTSAGNAALQSAGDPAVGREV